MLNLTQMENVSCLLLDEFDFNLFGWSLSELCSSNFVYFFVPIFDREFPTLETLEFRGDFSHCSFFQYMRY